jgi:hypothetical protein
MPNAQTKSSDSHLKRAVLIAAPVTYSYLDVNKPVTAGSDRKTPEFLGSISTKKRS